MKIEISSAQKLSILTSAKHQIVHDLYSVCAPNGIDPEELDPSNPEANKKYAELVSAAGEKEGSPKHRDLVRINELCAAYVMTQGKIDAI